MFIYFLTLKKSHLTFCDPMYCSPPCSSVHGIFQARILEWVVIPTPQDVPDPGIEPASCVSCALLALQSHPSAPRRQLRPWQVKDSSKVLQSSNTSLVPLPCAHYRHSQGAPACQPSHSIPSVTPADQREIPGSFSGRSWAET